MGWANKEHDIAQIQRDDRRRAPFPDGPLACFLEFAGSASLPTRATVLNVRTNDHVVPKMLVQNATRRKLA